MFLLLRKLCAFSTHLLNNYWQYPLCTLLVFDSRRHALPVAWIISRSNLKSDVDKWMKILLKRAQSVEPGFRINAFIIDDAALEIDPIRHE